MTKKDKEKVMNQHTSEINKAKDILYRVSDALLDAGLARDSETLFRMVLRIEEFQTKYDEYRL